MTAPVSAVAGGLDRRAQAAVGHVVDDLGHVAARLNDDATAAEVRAARELIDDAGRALAGVVRDPWEPSALPLREAREILSSHLLAASACEAADVAPAVTARVLRRGALAARGVLVTRTSVFG
jgi:hypothetical protein